MNPTIKVMLCDDSSTMRRLIKSALKIDPRVNVVYEAKDGQDAVDNLEKSCPDVVVMDVEMPVMDGIEATREIRRRNPKLPIVMFSSLTGRGAEATLDALTAGATDFAVKPTAAGHIKDAMAQLQTDLLPKIIQAATPQQLLHTSKMHPNNPRAVQRRSSSETALQRIHAIAIGVSTGGPDALAKLLTGIPKNFPCPILIAQHMPPVFTSLLATRLASRTGHDVREAVDGEVVEKGRVFLAPGDFHLTTDRKGVQVQACLDQKPSENSCRPAVDPLFRSVAKCYGRNALGIVLTGMGQDGTLGAGSIKSAGGSVIVQDEASSVIWGMPGKVVATGHADKIMPLNEIAKELARRVPQAANPSLTTI